ncbi:MAG: LPS export ABC transporter permease LptF [Acetobacteraceae bacterium]
MRGLTRYVLRQLVVGLLAVTGGLAVLIWLTQSLRFIELVLNRGLSIGVFFELTVFMLPNFVAVILPVTTFMVILAVYSRMEGDRELVVMSAAGMGPGAIARPALMLAAGAAALGWVMNLWIVPESYRAFRDYQFEIRNRMAAVLLQEGVFSTLGEGLTVYVRARDPDGSFLGILVHDSREAGAPATILAERGWLDVEGPVPRVTLRNGSRQEVDRRTGTLRVLSFAENTLSLATETDRDETRYREARERHLRELLRPDPAEQVSERDRRRFLVEAHQRLSGPLLTVSLGLLAVAVLLTGEFSRYGKSGRVLVAVGLGAGLIALGLGLGNLAARHLVLVPLIWVHAVGPGLVAALWLLIPPRPRVPDADATPG